MNRRAFITASLKLALSLWATSAVSAAFAAEPKLAPLQTVAAFYNEHCVRCHKEGKAKGGFRMDELLARPNIEGHDDPWKNVLEKLAGREMPPEDEEKRPAHADYEKQIAWLRGELEKSEQLTASARPRAQRRLNRAEYNRTVSDLFGVPLRPADAFPPDDRLHGFDNVAEGLNTSTVLLEQYLASAQQIATEATRQYEDKPPERGVFSLAVNDRDPQTFRLFDPNALIHFGGTDRQPAQRQWVGHAIGSDYGVTAPGFYTVSVYGEPRNFAPGERAIIRLDVKGRAVGLFDSAPVGAAQTGQPLMRTRLWLTPGRFQSEASAVFTFTFVNGNPYGAGVGETVDYYPSCWGTFHQEKKKRFPEQFEKTSDGWMPEEPPDLPIRRIANVRLEIAGPENKLWPPVGFQRELAAALKAGDLTAVVSGLLPKAFRRPVTNAEVTRIVKFAETSQPTNAPFNAKLQAALTRILVAPEFLFLVEAVPPNSARGGYTLTHWELAARLSYFLTGTAPDAELRVAAARGELTNPKQLDAQVTRLLRDPRCVTALTEGFLNSWLHLDRLAGVMPEPKLFPQFGDDLKRSMAEEPKAFFAALLRDNGKVTDLLDSDYAWVNERLAMHYGLDRGAIRGSELRRVALPNRQRGGLVGMGGVLTLTSENTRTSPVKRGIYVLEQIFNRPPPPPPPNVGDLIPNTAAAKSIREHLALHRENAACAGCHNRIDPWGLALENFDAVGAWRDSELAWEDPSRPTKRKEGEKPPTFAINAAFELPIMSDTAKRATGVEAARAELLHRRADFARGLTEKLMTYALGRGLVISDQRHVEAVTAALKQNDYRVQALIHAIVQSPPFRTR